MSQRRRGSVGAGVGKTFENIRELAEGVMIRTQEAMGRVEHRHNSPYESSDLKFALAKTYAKKISVVLFVLSVSIAAVVLALYYALAWRPSTDRIFPQFNTSSVFR